MQPSYEVEWNIKIHIFSQCISTYSQVCASFSTDDGIHIGGLVQDCSISSELAMKILQSCT